MIQSMLNPKSTKKHIAFFLPSLDGGGAEKITLRLAEQLASTGYNCDIVVAIKKGQLLHSTPRNSRLIFLGKKKTIYALFSLAHYLYREKPDALMATIFTGNITAGLAHAISRSRARLVLREASLPDKDAIASNRIRTWLNKLFAKITYGRADASIAVSEGVKQSLIKGNLIPAERIHVVPNPAIITSIFKQDREVIKRPLLVACGRLEPQKDYETLIKAFAEVRKFFDADLTILGEGSLRASLDHLAKELKVDTHISFKGFVHDPGTYMREASVFVHTATYEGFGGVVLEALANGCKIVATNCPGVCEVLDNGRYGALIPVGDVVKIKNAILAILRGELDFPSPEDHLRSYSIDTICKRYISILLPD